MENKTQTDKVSVIIPNWNYGMFLREAIDSILNQTVLPKQIIITDDCSTDSSRDIIAEYCEKYPDLIVSILNTERLGTIKNENGAMPLVTAPWAFYLDADDYVDPTYIEKAVGIMKVHYERLAIIYSDMMKIGNWSGAWQVSDWDPFALRTGNYINGHSLFRTDLFREVGGLRETGGFEDHQLWVDFLDLGRGYYGVHIPESLVFYRRHDYGHRTDGTDINTRNK